MSLLKSVIDNVGDMLGTSKLAHLNRTVFRPIIGTSITREEYNASGMSGRSEVPHFNRQEAKAIKDMEPFDKIHMANNILDQMVENGTVFRESRIARLAAVQQTHPGTTNLTYRVINQLSPEANQELHSAMSRQLMGPFSMRR